jgi:chondroitin AC lyase
MKNSMLLFITLLFSTLRVSAQTEYVTIMDRIRAELLATVSSVATLDNNVTTTLASLQSNGSWPDVNYAYSSTTYTADVHINRVKAFAQAYTHPSSSYYHDAALFTAITSTLGYWDTADPQSWNWYHNQISNPQRTGEILILLETSPQPLPATLRSNLLNQMNRGVPANQTGANKLDVATHFMYRACLTANDSLMQLSVSEIFYPLVLTTAEGIQHDLSFQQHGPQLYFFGYGSVFVEGETKMAYYLRGTSYALAGDKLSLFSNFVRNGFLKAMRARYIDFSTNGRSISRVNNLAVGITAHLEKLKVLDPAHVTEYNQAIARLNGSQPPSYMISPRHTHFWRADYTVHHRPGYLFGLKTVSTRTVKTENGNGENLKGYYLTEGATYIAANGNEYYNIPPVWDWARIPGTTVPYITTIPLRTSWGVNYGTAAFCGGVSDTIYGASAMAFNEYNTQARKAWFFFDKEVVCLGAGISSTAAQPVNTTVNQCLLSGTVTARVNSSVSTLPKGAYSYNGNLRWIMHGGTGYYFPNGGNLRLQMQAQSGTWRSINNGGTTTVQNMDVFQLWFDHGASPVNGSYAYYVIPGQDMSTYDTTAVHIEQNNAAMQVVYHSGLKVRQLVFYQAGTFHNDSVSITVDQPCILMLKQAGTASVKLSIADPAQSSQPVNIYLDLPGISQTRHLTCNLPSGPYAGSTASYTVDAATPVHNSGELTAIADAYVRGGSYSGVNYGSGTLVLKKDATTTYTREVFLKFDVGNLPAATAQVKLRMYVNYANSGAAGTPWIVQVAGNNWTEAGINWNNMPAAAAPVDTVSGLPAGNYAEWDVSSAAIAAQAGDGILSLKLTAALAGATTDASFDPREHADPDRQPALVYSTSSSVLSAKTMFATAASSPDVSIYPNPFHNFIRVNTLGNYRKAELRDAAGKIIHVKMLQGRKQFEIPVEKAPQGVYFLILTGDQEKTVKKLVKI